MPLHRMERPPTRLLLVALFVALLSLQITTGAAFAGTATPFWVDDNYPDFTTCPGSSGTTINVSAFTTVQAAINAVGSFGTINVCPGTYAENITIPATKSGITIIGANDVDQGSAASTCPAALPANTTAESVIVPAANDAADGNLVTVQADNVTLRGLTFDGDNPALSGGVALNGVDVNTRRAVSNGTNAGDSTARPPIDGLLVRNNILRNLTGGVILFRLDGDSATFANVMEFNDVIDNRFDNLPRNPTTATRYGVYAGYNVYADVTDNCFTRTHVAVNTINTPDPTTDAGDITDNYMSVYSYGAWMNNHYGNHTPYTVRDNTITRESADFFANNAGILLWSYLQSTTVIVEDNNVSGMAFGVRAWNLPTTTPITISGGTLANNGVGVRVYNYESAFSGTNVNLTLDSVTITGSSVAGAEVIDNPLNVSANNAPLLTIANTTITGGLDGIVINGTEATVNLNTVALTGQSGDYIELIGSPIDINSSTTTFAGVLPQNFTYTQYAAAEAKVVHDVDDTALGLVFDPVAQPTDTNTPTNTPTTTPTSTPSATNTVSVPLCIVVSRTSFSVTEGGISVIYNLRLSAQPAAGETVTLTPSFDATQISLSPLSRQLNASNWNTGRNFTVTAVNDLIDEVNSIATVITHTASSNIGGSPFNGIQGCNVINVTVIDNDDATATPTATATSTATDTATTTPTDTATNTPTNTPTDTATSTATDTATNTPTNTPTSTTTPTVTTTPTATQPPFVCQIIFIPPSIYSVTEAGATYTFNVRLSVQPAAGETFNLVPSYDTTQLVVTPPSRQLTSANWNTGRNFTITAINDAVVEGNLDYQVFVNATSNLGRTCTSTHALVTVVDNDSASQN